MTLTKKSNDLTWTGERFLPDLHGTIVLEHLHRYKAAAMLVRGKTVLDIASGEGYGSYLLAEQAATVVGVDIDATAVTHASKKYLRPNLRFKEGSCAAIPLADHSVQVIVSFETIEHHTQHEEMMAEIKRVLTPDGLLIISSPNKVEYSEVPGFKNAFHPRELYLEEFESWLRTGFSNIEIYGQRVVEASVIAPTTSSRTQFRHFIGSTESNVEIKTGLDKSVYFLALASNRSLPELNTSLFEVQSERRSSFVDHAFIVTIYWNDGLGFSEEKSVTKHCFASGGRQTLEFEIKSASPIIDLRVDPSDRPGLLNLFGIQCNENEVDFAQLEARKQLLALPSQELGHKYLVLGDDPQFYLKPLRGTQGFQSKLIVTLDLSITEIAAGQPELSLLNGTQEILAAQTAIAMDMLNSHIAKSVASEKQLTVDFESSLQKVQLQWDSFAHKQQETAIRSEQLAQQLGHVQTERVAETQRLRSEHEHQLHAHIEKFNQLQLALAREVELKFLAQAQVSSLRNTLSWRLTAPLRLVRRIFYPEPSVGQSADFSHIHPKPQGSIAIVPPNADAHEPVPTNAALSNSLVDQLHAVKAVRPAPENDYAIVIPFVNSDSSKPSITRVAVVVHIFYDELASDIARRLNNIPCAADVFISTTSEAKRESIAKQFSFYKNGAVEIRIFENRGRDIAPKLIGFADVYARYEFFLHLHSKKTLHAGDRFAHWRDYLYDSLLPSKEGVASILELLADPKIGIVFSEHLPEMRPLLNWGWNFESASQLLASKKISLFQDMTLEFPSGSMFWGRCAALKPLLDLNLQFSDFEQEAGQYDGTLGHAIERSFLYLAEAQGFSWVKVSASQSGHALSNLVTVQSGAAAQLVADRFSPLLESRPFCGTALSRSYQELTPFRLVYSSIKKPRLNLLVPSINPSQSFGGIATAIKVFKELVVALGDAYDVRVIATDASIEADGTALFEGYTRASLKTLDKAGRREVQPAHDRRDLLLNIRPNDIFLATAWWTALHGFRFGDFQALHGVKAKHLLYLIQDYEPSFYGWSSKWALAEGTYKRPERTVALINSEELYRSLTNQNYRFENTFVLPFRLNETIQANLQTVQKEKLLLIYGRPSVERNCTEVVIDALRLWQLRSPSEAARWTIVSLGESYSAAYALDMPNVVIKGKVSLEEYAKLLSRASVGVSLMVSPHPSYPPLEMAAAGIQTVTNRFEGKDLSLRSVNILSIDRIDPETVCEAILDAVGRVSNPQSMAMHDLGGVEPAMLFDANVVANLICDLNR